MTEEQVVSRCQRALPLVGAGSMLAVGIAKIGRAPGLVQGDPAPHPVTEVVMDQCRIIRETLRRITVAPSAVVLQRLREVPVVERGRRCDPLLEQRVDQPVVERQPFRVGHSPALRLDARPGHREAVAVDPEVTHQTHVIGVPVIVVAGDVAIVPASDPARGVAEGVPDRPPAPAHVHSPLDLVRRRRHTQLEAAWQLDPAHPFGCPYQVDRVLSHELPSSVVVPWVVANPVVVRLSFPARHTPAVSCRTVTPYGASSICSTGSPPRSGTSPLPGLSRGRTTSGALHSLTNQTNRLPSSWTRPSTSTSGLSTVTACSTPATSASAEYRRQVCSGLTRLHEAARCSRG